MAPLASNSNDSLADDAPSAGAAAERDVADWLTHLVRTLKTCRLYDSGNPTVTRFRADLTERLQALLGRHGAVKLDVGSRDLLYEGSAVLSARSRDDNLPGIFHRDGIRAITLLPGIEPREVEALVDLTLHVTGPLNQDDDLVTLFWQANLLNIAVVSVPLEADVDGGGHEDLEDGPAMPWPGQPAGATGQAPTSGAGAGASGDEERETRCDDWQRVADFAAAEESFAAIEAAGPREIARFQQEYDGEMRASVVGSTVGVLAHGLTCETTPEDRAEIGRFLPRVLREAIALGEWGTARAALEHLRLCDPQWPAGEFFTGLGDASSLVTRKAVQALDQQGDQDVAAFLALARELGAGAIEWLMTVLAESQQKRARLPLTHVIAELVKNNPECILPWMSDERWYVVRNVVHILGQANPDEVAAYLRTATEHPETRVRRETVAALGEASPEVARPVLLAMLDRAEPRLFTLILQQLSRAPDATVARRLVELLTQPHFLKRPDEERRAVYMALASQGDEVLGALEEELHRGGMFAHGLDPHRQSVARCIARIGTGPARAVLERGLKSAKPGIRKACELARASLDDDHD